MIALTPNNLGTCTYTSEQSQRAKVHDEHTKVLSQASRLVTGLSLACTVYQQACHSYVGKVFCKGALSKVVIQLVYSYVRTYIRLVFVNLSFQVLANHASFNISSQVLFIDPQNVVHFCHVQGHYHSLFLRRTHQCIRNVCSSWKINNFSLKIVYVCIIQLSVSLQLLIAPSLICTYMYVCTSTLLHTCRLHTHTHIRTRTFVNVCIHTCMYVYPTSKWDDADIMLHSCLNNSLNLLMAT